MTETQRQRYEYVHKVLRDRNVVAVFRPVGNASLDTKFIPVEQWEQLDMPLLVEVEDQTGNIVATVDVPPVIEPEPEVTEVEPVPTNESLEAAVEVETPDPQPVDEPVDDVPAEVPGPGDPDHWEVEPTEPVQTETPPPLPDYVPGGGGAIIPPTQEAPDVG